MKKIFTLVLALAFFIPSVSSAATLSQSQVNAIIALLYAFNVDQLTILSVQKALAPQSATPIQNVQPQITQAPVVPQPTTPLTPSAPATTAPVSLARIEFVNRYLNSLPTDKTYAVLPSDCKLEQGVMNSFSCAYDSTNTVQLRAVVYKDDGSVDRAALVSVTATDSAQNKQLNGTGNMITFYTKDGQRHDEYGYVFNYGFTSAGSHTVTFTTANGFVTSMTLTAK